MARVIEGLEQGSKEWHAFRLQHIGASDIAKILLCDPFSGPTGNFQLFLEKTGQKKASSGGSAATRHGNENENIARLQYAGETGEVMLPCVLECDQPGWEFLSCSLDGGNHDLSRILEIKCPIEVGTFREAKEGQIGDNYYGQCQMALFISGATQLDYYCWFRGESVLIPVVPDPGYLETMLPAVKEFWRRVQAKEWPIPEGEIALESAEYLTWAKEMADLIEMEREVGNKIMAHKARGAREFFENAAKISGGGLEVTRQYKNGYTVPASNRAASIAVTIRRIE